MAEAFDPEAYLEEQLEGKPAAAEPPAKADDRKKEKSSKESGKDRERDRGDRDRDRDRAGKSGEKEKDRKDKDKDKDKKSSRHRSRSRSRDRKKDKDKKSDKDRERKRSRSNPRKSRSPRRRPTDEEREAERQLRKEEREAEERNRELEELDRDTRTVFAYNLSTKGGEREVFEFFGQAGTVLDVRIIYDRNTPKSKGMAYVEMSAQSEIPAALSLTGQMLMGQVVMVKASEAEKNLAWEAAQQQKKKELQCVGCRQ